MSIQHFFGSIFIKSPCPVLGRWGRVSCDTRCCQLTHTGPWCPSSRGKVTQDPVDVLGGAGGCSLSDAVSCYLMLACGRGMHTLALFFLLPAQARAGQGLWFALAPQELCLCALKPFQLFRDWFSGWGIFTKAGFCGLQPGNYLYATLKVSLELSQNSRSGGFGEEPV